MRRVLQYGYDKEGQFVIQAREDDHGQPYLEQLVSLSRAECQKISKHMQFGKKGVRHFELSLRGHCAPAKRVECE